jgi:hypothetical protein
VVTKVLDEISKSDIKWFPEKFANDSRSALQTCELLVTVTKPHAGGCEAANLRPSLEVNILATARKH